MPSSYEPERGDQVDQWLRRRRDELEGVGGFWVVIDNLLDDYRLHADTGTPLYLDVHVAE